MAHLKPNARRACRPQLVVLVMRVVAARDAAQDHHLNACALQMRQLVGNGLAGRAAIHIEGVRQHQPALLERWADLRVQGFVLGCHLRPSSLRGKGTGGCTQTLGQGRVVKHPCYRSHQRVGRTRVVQ